MKVDPATSAYQEDPAARKEFSRRELKSLRYLLRRLRFLETKIAQSGGLADPRNNGGSVHAEWEAEALEFVLTEIGFLADSKIGESA